MSWPRYEGAGPCTGKAQPGATALMEVCIKDFGARNLGIYNCRAVRGSTNRSLHGEGRALDPGYSRIADGDRLLAVLLRHRMALGVQLIIWNRRIYSAKAPLGARYQGTVPHTDHLHVELVWGAARSLTQARVRQIIGGAIPAPPAPKPPAPKPQPQPVPLPEDDDDMIYIRRSNGAIWRVNGNTAALLDGPAWKLDHDFAAFVGKPITPLQVSDANARAWLATRIDTRTGRSVQL